MDEGDGVRREGSPSATCEPPFVGDMKPATPGDPTTVGFSLTTGPRTPDGSGQRTAYGRHANFWQSLRHDVVPPILFGLLLAAIFGALGAVASLGGQTTYTSTTVMLIDDPYALATNGSSDEFVKLDALRVKYSGLISTDAIAQPVASRLHLPLGEVLGAVSAQVPFEGLLMDVSATWSNAHEAQVVSQAVANQVTTYVHEEDMVYNIPPTDQFTFNTVDPASPSVPHAPSRSRAVILAAALAVVGFLLAFLATQLVRYLR